MEGGREGGRRKVKEREVFSEVAEKPVAFIMAPSRCRAVNLILLLLLFN